MYDIIKIALVVVCLCGIIYMFKQKKSYEAFIAKSSARLFMVKDKTLTFSKEKYYLNKK